MKEPEGIAAKVLEVLILLKIKSSKKLKNLSVTVKSKWAHYIIHRAKSSELSMDEARKLHHNFVGTEHILLGLIREMKVLQHVYLQT